jgi:hypothetical protein
LIIRRPASRKRAGAAAKSSSRTERPSAARPTSCERADIDISLVGGQLAREYTENGRLTNAVRADEPHVLCQLDLERHTGKQQVTTGMGVREIGCNDVRHGQVQPSPMLD